jgi:hypothetical protein
MGNPVTVGPPGHPQAPQVDNQIRPWYVDEIVVAGFALVGVGGAVFLPLWFNIPPITTSFLLATGLAALTYRYLGGIQGATFTVGTLKLGGALAALVGIALLINNYLVAEIPHFELWDIHGQVADEAGKPIEPLDPKDFIISPSIFHQDPGGKFNIVIFSSPDAYGNVQYPSLSISHDGFDSRSIDFSPDGVNDVPVKRQGQSIHLSRVTLHHETKPYNPPANASLSQVPYTAESLRPGPEVKP